MAVAVLVGADAVEVSAQVQGNVLSITENADGSLTAIDSQLGVLPVTMVAKDQWSFVDPAFALYQGAPLAGPGAWKEPDWAASGQWNVLRFNAGTISVVSDVPLPADIAAAEATYGPRFQFNNGANHVIGVNDDPVGSFDPNGLNVNFTDNAPATPNDVPDGGATAALLALGLAGLGGLRRRLA